jgi:hypothetical protein
MRNHPAALRLKEAVISHRVEPRAIRLGVYRGIVRRMAPYNTLQVIWGLWERETYPFIRKGLSAAWMIDVGAGWGEMTVLFAKAGASPVYAVEPGIGWDAKIADTLALNGVTDGVEIVRSFIGQAPAMPLSDLRVPEGRGFIKIDVDTAEMDVLNSGAEFLRARRPMILLETHSAELEGQCVALLEGLGYRTEIIRNAWWRALIPERREWSPHNRWLWAE